MTRLQVVRIRDTVVSRTNLPHAERSARAAGRPLPGLYALVAAHFRQADACRPAGKRSFRRAA